MINKIDVELCIFEQKKASVYSFKLKFYNLFYIDQNIASKNELRMFIGIKLIDIICLYS